mmetsp:Transcript_68193/g.168492  ORF Transcript_68193/g.168492 Transcript_68193/m.168492 type:complete len:278 (-) Transcript_68193:2144-2977(-)
MADGRVGRVQELQPLDHIDQDQRHHPPAQVTRREDEIVQAALVHVLHDEHRVPLRQIHSAHYSSDVGVAEACKYADLLDEVARVPIALPHHKVPHHPKSPHQLRLEVGRRTSRLVLRWSVDLAPPPRAVEPESMVPTSLLLGALRRILWTPQQTAPLRRAPLDRAGRANDAVHDVVKVRVAQRPQALGDIHPVHRVGHDRYRPLPCTLDCHLRPSVSCLQYVPAPPAPQHLGRIVELQLLLRNGAQYVGLGCSAAVECPEHDEGDDKDRHEDGREEH